MGGRLYTERIDVSAAAVHRSLRLHPNLRLPNVPKGSSPEAIAKYVTEAIARYLSPPKADAEDNDFPCIDVATAIRDHLRPDAPHYRARRVHTRTVRRATPAIARKTTAGWAMKPYYEQGGVTIYHGDCREVLPLVTADVLVTDPPYPNNEGHFAGAVPIAREVISQWRGREAAIFWTEMQHPPCRLPLVAVHIWHRTNVNGRPYEPIYYYDTSGGKRRSMVRALPAVFKGAGPGCREYAGHPTQKSLPLMVWLVGQVRSLGVIADPFMGSGTTLVAAKRLGRRAIGIEIEERYCEIAAERLRQRVFDFEPERQPVQQRLEAAGSEVGS